MESKVPRNAVELFLELKLLRRRKSVLDEVIRALERYERVSRGGSEFSIRRCQKIRCGEKSP